MNSFVEITEDGRFSLDGKRWYCNSVIYFGHFPGGMENWFTDKAWEINRPRLETDFSRMEDMGLNHAALFLKNEMFFEAGKPVQKGYERLDEVVAAAKKHGIRLTFFNAQFIDNEDEYYRITGKKWEYGNRWLPSFNTALFEAYVLQMKPLVERYKNEPAVLGYGDRIDRFFKGFDNYTIPYNLKDEWALWLESRYVSFDRLLAAVGGNLEGDPKNFGEVLLPQESCYNASLKNPLAYDYILWQKKTIGETQARWDAEMLKLSPRQIYWTPFEGCVLDWPMLDDFTPETKRLRAIWMEYYHFQAVHTYPVFHNEWQHTGEMVTYRLHHESPTIYNTAYIMARYIKLSSCRPVVICHGARLNMPTTGVDTEDHQTALIDRVNAACLAADCDGWHYWCYTDDWQSSLAHQAEQKQNPHLMYWQGESLGLYDWDDQPRPAASLARLYSGELARRVKKAAPPETKETLLLSSAPLQYSLFRRLATPTAAAVNGALTRLGVECDYLWTAQNDDHITQETLNTYKLIVIADNAYGRDFPDMPGKLLRYVENGGTLYFALDSFDTFRDEHGVSHASGEMRKLAGVYEPARSNDWPGANDRCVNWPFPGKIPNEPNYDAQAFPRLHWGICPEFRNRAACAQRMQMLGFRSLDGDRFTIVPYLTSGAEVIAVGKFESGSKPFVYRHKIGKGTVYVNAWTNTVFRDSDRRSDYGGWDYDWILALPAETAGLEDVNLTGGASVWLRNTWGYFWKEL